MGWYLRKSFSFGPLRLNLSKSGLGYSFGVKGARIGTGPRGDYIHMGRYGLYYRQYFNTNTPHQNGGANEIPCTPVESVPTGTVIPTADVVEKTAKCHQRKERTCSKLGISTQRGSDRDRHHCSMSLQW